MILRQFLCQCIHLFLKCLCSLCLHYLVLPQPFYNHKKSNDENVSKWSLNLRARIGAVYNHKKMFVGLQGYADHHRYKSKGTYLINSTINFVALVGIRF